DILIKASRLKKVMADKGNKSINGKNAYELKGKFLDDLHNNAFSGTNGKDAVEHIEYYLNIIDPIKLPNVDHDKLRVVFSQSHWLEVHEDGLIKPKNQSCWVDLTAKFFRKYYPPSRIEGNNTPVIKWDPTNPRFEGCNNINIELSKEFLVELRKNIYHGTYNEDVVDHIAKEDGKITTWEEFVEKFFCRFYPESYDGEDKMLDEGDN
ncbi:hypothetical protein Tco_1414256, partial [Tanacetum coccineum]